MSKFFSRGTGTATIAATVSPACKGALLEFRFHLAAAPAATYNLTIDLDANAGSAYDTRLFTKDMNGLTDYIWPEPSSIGMRAFPFVNGDKFIINFSAATRYGYELIWEQPG